jgi:hypothetical protein
MHSLEQYQLAQDTDNLCNADVRCRQRRCAFQFGRCTALAPAPQSTTSVAQLKSGQAAVAAAVTSGEDRVGRTPALQQQL